MFHGREVRRPTTIRFDAVVQAAVVTNANDAECMDARGDIFGSASLSLTVKRAAMDLRDLLHHIGYKGRKIRKLNLVLVFLGYRRGIVALCDEQQAIGSHNLVYF